MTIEMTLGEARALLEFLNKVGGNIACGERVHDAWGKLEDAVNQHPLEIKRRAKIVIAEAIASGCKVGGWK